MPGERSKAGSVNWVTDETIWVMIKPEQKCRERGMTVLFPGVFAVRLAARPEIRQTAALCKKEVPRQLSFNMVKAAVGKWLWRILKYQGDSFIILRDGKE